MYWTIPRIWEGGECWLIGGGPSIPYEFGVPKEVIQGVQNGDIPVETYSPYLSQIHGKHVIAINAAYKLGSWVDMVFYGDGRFYWNNIKDLRAIPKLKITCNPTMKERAIPENVKVVHRDMRKTWGISDKPSSICWNKNSGAAAINLAYHFGVKRIFLLGFDMTLGEHGNQHWHRHYLPPGESKDPKRVPFRRHLPAFPSIAKDAKRLGLEIYNISQNSEIFDFPKITVEEALNL